MPDAISPAEELKQLQAALKANQEEAARLQARVAEVTKIDQKSKEFEKAAGASQKQLDDLKEFIDGNKRELEAKVPKAEIEAKKREAEAKLQELKTAVENAAKTVRDKEAAVEAAKKEVANKQKAYDDIAGRAAANTAVLSDLASLRTVAEKALKADDLARAYFLILIMSDRVQRLKLTPANDYVQELKKAREEVVTAMTAQKDAQATLEKAKNDEKAAAKKFEDDKAKWVQVTADCLPKGSGTPPQQGTPTPAPSTPTTVTSDEHSLPPS